MNILHVSHMYAPILGGAEHHLQIISEGLVSRGHGVTVFAANVTSAWDSCRNRYGELPEVEIIKGVKVVRFDPNGGNLRKALDRWMSLKGGYCSVKHLFSPDGLELLLHGPRMFSVIPQILRFDGDIVASMNWFWPPAYHTHLARRLKRFKLVGIPLFHTTQPWCGRSIYRTMLPVCDAVAVNTKHEKEFVEERGARRVEVAGVGIDPKGFEARDGRRIRERYGLGSCPVVGYVGREDPEKGLYELIRAMPTVWRWNKEVRLLLAGPRLPSNRDIEAALECLSDCQKNKIVHIGAFDEAEKASIFDALDVFALPSRAESFGIAYLEAWLCHKPVIGARVAVSECVIADGVDGLLVRSKDPEDIARAIIALLSDNHLRAQMGRNGYTKTRTQYTWDAVIDRMEGLYLDVSSGRSKKQFFAERATQKQSFSSALERVDKLP